MKNLLLAFCVSLFSVFCYAQNIPLPEHPRPDFERADWVNLNGKWAFEFDSLNVGESKNWQKGESRFTKTINVPFPWGAPLSGLKDEADIAWYQKNISVPSSFRNKRTFVTVGASDWLTTVWLDGNLVGSHQGGYTPFSFELTSFVKYDSPQKLVIKVDDKRRNFTLYGKQGYGNARGIWQTIYLEARGKSYLESVHFSPDIDLNKVKVETTFDAVLAADQEINFEITTPTGILSATSIAKKGSLKAESYISIPNARLWTLEDPFLYLVKVKAASDDLKTYFGMRKISVTKLPGTDIPYVALNNKPIYLQLTLDQSYHPDGFYTFPTDEFMKNEIQLCKNIGLNGLRTHIKVDVPRKLYWADKLGLLVMADLPNFWGEPDADAQKESENTLREMIKRDYNHPAIFSWIVFNETWGLRTKVKNEATGKDESKYLPETQNWVASMYYLAKSLDLTRLAEDNSICCGAGHTETDINSWHEYLPGYEWEAHMQKIDKGTFPGSSFHFEKGFTQGDQPMINSECGNVWGYDGSTGDVDWSYDYHRMMNTFRVHPKMSGWLYTEHHDVINEWNGYWRFDRSPKYSGLGDLVEGMTDKDFHSDIYVSTGQDITKTVSGGESFEIPLFVSAMTDKKIEGLNLTYEVSFMDKTGNAKKLENNALLIDYQPWMQKRLAPMKLTAPKEGGLGTVKLFLKNKDGEVLHCNFFSFVVNSNETENGTQIVTVNPKDFAKAQWSQRQWNVFDGLKANGAGKGYFEYNIPVKNIKKAKSAYILMEVSSKPMLDKDQEKANYKNQDYMLGARVSPHLNPNAYPMTDDAKNPSTLTVSVNGKNVKTTILADDPADHRGILSWHSQPQNRKLNEAGTYGELVRIPVSLAEIKAAEKQGFLKLKLEGTNGLAVYGENFGRYPIGINLILK